MALTRTIIGTEENGATLDGTTTEQNGKFKLYGSQFSLHIVFASGGSDLEANIELWVSNKENPDETSDTDWVQNTTDITFTGISAAASAKEEHTVGNASHQWYRISVNRTAGSGTVTVRTHQTSTGPLR